MGDGDYRLLERFGFIAVRQRGSHRIMQKRAEDTTTTVPVPLHDRLKRGTVKHHQTVRVAAFAL